MIALLECGHAGNVDGFHRRGRVVLDTTSAHCDECDVRADVAHDPMGDPIAGRRYEEAQDAPFIDVVLADGTRVTF